MSPLYLTITAIAAYLLGRHIRRNGERRTLANQYLIGYNQGVVAERAIWQHKWNWLSTCHHNLAQLLTKQAPNITIKYEDEADWWKKGPKDD